MGMQLFVCVLFPYPRTRLSRVYLSRQTSQVNGPYAAGATLRGARGWPRNWIALFIMLANFQRA